uniref:Uncharacterized protein n=1 Tax=Lactuca sativa TaxID=4236 RepID=A0A9R1X751_LACSA|nr:hypothetical protein LSAT_V11C600335680 [Lactuca sativa]
MEALDFMEFDMTDVINKVPIVAMHKSSNDGALGSKCLMANIVESHPDVSHDNVGTLDDEPSHADKKIKLEYDDTLANQIPDQCEKILGVSNSEPEDQSKSSTSDDSSMHHEPHEKVISEHNINVISYSKTMSITLKSKNQSSSDLAVEKKIKSYVKGKNYEIKDCYRCGYASHKVSECTSEKNSIALITS